MKEFIAVLLLIASCVSSTTVFARPQLSNANRMFIRFMAGNIRHVNQEVLHERRKLQRLHQQYLRRQPLSQQQQAWLQTLADKYGLDNNKLPLAKPAFWLALLSRVNEIPVDLAVAQAINESAWGRSRFAKEGNNYFGRWCYKSGCGLVPEQRSDTEKHEVKVFESALDSTRDYVHNLNTNVAYKPLRQIRDDLQASGQPLTGGKVAAGLTRYSKAGSHYVYRIRKLIKDFQLNRLLDEGHYLSR